MMWAAFGLFLWAIAAIDTSAAQAACFDVSKGEPSHLSGHLTPRVFAGAPNFKDVAKGDAPEPGYVLKLAVPICLTGDDDFTDPGKPFDEVQLVPSEDLGRDMANFDDTNVDVELVNSMPAMTMHHHRPLVAWVKSISFSHDATDSDAQETVLIKDFYAALHSGNGALAATFVVPEKTKSGAFAPQVLTAFYSSLSDPMTLTDVRAIDQSHYSVLYHFRREKHVCDGAAKIALVHRGGRTLIQSISAKNGC